MWDINKPPLPEERRILIQRFIYTRWCKINAISPNKTILFLNSVYLFQEQSFKMILKWFYSLNKTLLLFFSFSSVEVCKFAVKTEQTLVSGVCPCDCSVSPPFPHLVRESEVFSVLVSESLSFCVVSRQLHCRLAALRQQCTMGEERLVLPPRHWQLSLLKEKNLEM